jgi:hypothetical protein
MMTFAIAALLLHLAPAADARIVTDVTTTVVASAAADAASAASPAIPAKPTPNPQGSGAGAGAATVSLAETTNTQTLSTFRLPDPASAKPVRVIAVETVPPRKAWLMLSLAQHGAAAFDAYTTRQAISAGAREDDPFMRPFAHSPSIYIVSQIAPTVLDYAARRMQRDQHAFIRHSWWLPQSASTAFLAVAGAHNLQE